MKTQPRLLRIITPPPIGPSNVIHADDQQAITRKALGLHLSKSVPTSAPRSIPFKLNLITVHPSQPLVAYLLVPDSSHDNKKTSTLIPRSVIVQHVKTRAVLWSMSLADMACILFEVDVLSHTAEARLHKLVKELGQVQGLDFFDPSTLYWNGHGSVPSGTETATERWSYLMVQFTNRVLILNLRKHSVSLLPKKSSQKNKNSIFKPVVANITQDSLSGVMSSNVVPVSRTVVVVGTTDGYIRLYDWSKEVVIQSIKVLSTKNDAIVHIRSTNKYGTPEYYATSKRRMVCLTKRGAAVLMELSVTEGIVHDISQPIAKFEGGSVPSSMSKQDDDHSSMEHLLVHYCGYRDLLMWSHPSKTKSKMLVWDMSNIPEQDAKQKKKNEPPKPDPLLVLQFPYETSHTILPGWFHESVPMESMTCAAVTKDGDFFILVAPLYNSGSTIKNPFTAVPVMSKSLPAIMVRDLELAEDRELYIRVQSIFCPALRDASTFFIGTNIGVAMIRMVDSNLVPIQGCQHAHLSANAGGMGKAILGVKGPEISYAALEPSGGPLAVNPIGKMENKNIKVVYESPPPLHLPPEIHKRPVRLPPNFLPSPSRAFLCCFWKEEMRYEVLHIPTMLDRVTSRTNSGQSPVVASGNGVASFAWVGDDDVYCLLYNPQQDLALKMGIDLSAPTASLGKELASAASNLTDLGKLRDLSRLKEMSLKSGAKAVAGTAGKLKSLEGLRDIAKSGTRATTGTMKGIGKVGMGTVKLTAKVGVGAVKGTTKVTTKLAVGTANRGAKLAASGGKVTKLAVGGAAKVATFGLVGRKKKNANKEPSLATADDSDDETSGAAPTAPLDIVMDDGSTSKTEETLASEKLERKYPWVELRALIGVTGADGNVNSATSSNLGALTLRSGNRNPPTVLFGGPVLCVGSKLDQNDEGLAYFYTLKKGSEENSAADFVSSGPAFPCPDIIAWDEDGRLCAVVIHARVSIYLSDEPNFIMLGTARLGSSADQDVHVTSARFIHGVLYCTTRASVQCIFLGDLDGSVCHLDTFTLASSEVPTLPAKSIVSDYNSLTPPIIPMALNHPIVLGYQNGSLILSTVSGVQALPLGFPLMRIGALIGAGHHQKAERWFDAVPQSDHESLATFLERRGVPELALQLSGVSLETTVDICMRYGHMDRLEEVVEIFGVNGLRSIDMGRGFASSIFGPEEHGMSVVVCVGAFLMSQGKVELVRRLATECLGSGEEGKRDALTLASLLLSVEGSDSKRVIQRAVEDVEPESDWLVGSFVRHHVL